MSRRRHSRWELWDDPKRKSPKIGLPHIHVSDKVDPVTWVRSLLRMQGPVLAMRICRRLAVPMFIGSKKQASVNPSSGFYGQALAYLSKHHKPQYRAQGGPGA